MFSALLGSVFASGYNTGAEFSSVLWIVLAVIIAIRTLLSFALELEVSGRWPWQRPPGGKDRQ